MGDGAWHIGPRGEGHKPKLGRRVNVRVWGAKRVRKGEAGVLRFHAEFVIPF